MSKKTDVIYSVSGGRNANTFVKIGGNLIAGFKEKSDATLFVDIKMEHESAAESIRRRVIEECAVAAENHSRVGRDYLPDSVWDNINNEVAKRIRNLALVIKNA